jgi:hypothetical protein
LSLAFLDVAVACFGFFFLLVAFGPLHCDLQRKSAARTVEMKGYFGVMIFCSGVVMRFSSTPRFVNLAEDQTLAREQIFRREDADFGMWAGSRTSE